MQMTVTIFATSDTVSGVFLFYFSVEKNFLWFSTAMWTGGFQWPSSKKLFAADPISTATGRKERVNLFCLHTLLLSDSFREQVELCTLD